LLGSNNPLERGTPECHRLSVVAALRSVPAIIETAPLESQIREVAKAYKQAAEHAAELEQSSLDARSVANEARAAANAKLAELGALLVRARKQQAAQDWDAYLSSLGVEHAQLAFDYIAIPHGKEPPSDHAAPTPAPKGRPLRIDDDIMAVKIAVSCEQEALARYAEAKVSKDPAAARTKVDAAREQLMLARRNLDEILGATHVGQRHVSSPGRDFDANREGLRKLYHDRVEQKQCTKCGAPALPGQVRCHTHRQVLAEQAQRRKEEGE
jgi:hypothetical protein